MTARNSKAISANQFASELRREFYNDSVYYHHDKQIITMFRDEKFLTRFNQIYKNINDPVLKDYIINKIGVFLRNVEENMNHLELSAEDMAELQKLLQTGAAASIPVAMASKPILGAYGLEILLTGGILSIGAVTAYAARRKFKRRAKAQSDRVDVLHDVVSMLNGRN